ncbi:MAG: pyridoxamine 5'-phosphate oxidase family protein [Proteobacteria bacterium]|nr:pyridoxamine 5'-phosphate oxidase family protein [Pseudomonadota bacterium]
MVEKKISDVLFSPAVKNWQEEKGSRAAYARMEKKGGFRDTVDDYLAGFIAMRNSFYLGTASADGQPYIQHRGGKKGFLKVLDDKTLAFADFKGNRQYISAGNLSDNPKAYIFLMDYVDRRRIKIWGEAKVVENDPALLKRLVDQDYPGIPERAIVFTISAWDINCPQHIPVKFDEAEIEDILKPLQDRIAELEAELSGKT